MMWETWAEGLVSVGGGVKGALMKLSRGVVVVMEVGCFDMIINYEER
jgi:hypothetical protein